MDVAKIGDWLCSGFAVGIGSNCIDAASFGGGVRIMKPSGVDGNRPVTFIRIQNWHRLESHTRRKVFGCCQHGPVAQGLFPKFSWVDQIAIQEYLTLLALLFPFREFVSYYFPFICSAILSKPPLLKLKLILWFPSEIQLLCQGLKNNHEHSRCVELMIGYHFMHDLRKT